MTKFIPLGDRVAIKRVESEEKTAGGIIIPDSAKEKPMQGEVVAVGTGNYDNNGKLIPLNLKEGQIVLFTKWAGTEIKVGEQDLLVMKESDIIGVLEG